MNTITDNSIIALDQFIQSTRDSGYKSTASAISELVDNAIQAQAKTVSIQICSNDEGELNVAIIDDGCGMDSTTLTQAMRFGGSSRFNDRLGLGRFGMGLPNASLSQARRVEVYSWQNGSPSIFTYLDVDEIASSSMTTVPFPIKNKTPEWIGDLKSTSGTAVVWTLCDRLDHRRVSTIEKKLHQALGRIFRYFLWDDVKISINGQPVAAIDPLYVAHDSPVTGASTFQDTWQLELYANPADPNSPTGIVEVTFSELPVHKWHYLPNDEKRRLGVANGAGASIVRSGREVDFGWYFMGSKRRENYDDWWRCEIKFDAVLDEAFGITHTKQQIKPKEYLIEALQPYIESMAKALNGRVRQAHVDIKVNSETSTAEKVAQDRDKRMRPLSLPERETEGLSNMDMIEQLAKRHIALRHAMQEPQQSSPSYHIVEDEMADTCFFKPLVSDGIVVSVINPRHKFYKKIYKPAMENQNINGSLSQAVQLMVLAAARAEAALIDTAEIETVERFRREWSHAMDVLLA